MISPSEIVGVLHDWSPAILLALLVWLLFSSFPGLVSIFLAALSAGLVYVVFIRPPPETTAGGALNIGVLGVAALVAVAAGVWMVAHVLGLAVAALREIRDALDEPDEEPEEAAAALAADEADLTIAEAAARLRVSMTTVRRWIRRQRLRATLVPGPHGPEYRVSRTEVAETVHP